MKKMIVVCCSWVIAVLSGCSEDAKTPQWYVDHPDVLEKVYAACKESGDATLNCQSAIQAHFQIQQLNAPIPGFDGMTRPDERAKIAPFKSYDITVLGGKRGVSKLEFPASLQGKSLNDLKNVRQILSESELTLAEESCDKIKEPGVQIPNDTGRNNKYRLKYACQFLELTPRENNFKP
ncbi:EexN family lipoprotein [Pseudomonas meliae]|uniref:Lipoprotein n=1 Tax=Pseudomonas meliae TaxID=86176 RepID=A0A0P9VLY0_9PSED|nr:EexN family lipoprotein [Pseudomonas meliae]KPX86315.1 hypothetical protein ALO64_200002 [Pseudomonas meliae]